MSGEAVVDEDVVTDVVVRVVRCLAPEEGVDVALDSDLRDDLGYHSLALVELGFLLEDAFALDPIPREVAEPVRTVRDVATLVLATTTERGFVFEDDGSRVAQVLEELEDWGSDW